MASSTVEDYLKTLYAVHQSTGGTDNVPIGRLASAMGVVPGTATSMMKALADAGLVEYESRAGVRLSPRGEQLALHVLRRHRLVELFLVDVLGLDWSVVHEEADLLEHAISDRVLEKMDLLLGHPTVDPHGDPIPTSKGKLHEPQWISLAVCEVGPPYHVTRVLNQNIEFLQFVERQGLRPGAIVTVRGRDVAADTSTIVVRGRKPTSVSLAVASQILVATANTTAAA
ncbi:MAG: metal-dependent transcriptional regulator [Gemmatimonadaceae bacterium]